jgi:hypothetical protein
MVRQICIAFLVLPSVCIQMSDLQKALPAHGQRWNMENINHMMESTTKLIQHGMTTKITPTIERFAKAAIDKIDNEVIPGVASENEAAVNLIDQEYRKFFDIITNVESKRSEIASRDEECMRYTTEHENCRHEEHTIQTTVTECEEAHVVCTNDWTLCEESVKISEKNMETLWCEDDFDALSKDFFRNSVTTMKTYIERRQRCTTKRDECEEQAPKCETKTHEKTETRIQCNIEQEHLEQCTCERANLVEHWIDHFTQEWHNLTAVYEEIFKDSDEIESKLVKEYEGLHVVKCLLQKIVDLGQTEGPCNESHVEKVSQEVRACYNLVIDSSAVRFPVPKPSPNFPPLYEHNPYPCGPDFIAQYYAHLPEGARANECDSHYCLPKLVDHIVVHR